MGYLTNIRTFSDKAPVNLIINDLFWNIKTWFIPPILNWQWITKYCNTDIYYYNHALIVDTSNCYKQKYYLDMN